MPNLALSRHPLNQPQRERDTPLRHLALQPLAATALLLTLLTSCSSPSTEDSKTDGDGGGAVETAKTAAKNTTGCPDGELLKPLLGSPAFSLAKSGDWHGGGWFCRYEPAGNNPNGDRLDVYTQRDGYDAGRPGSPADGYGALPEYGTQAYFATSCPSDPGTGRLTVHFARKEAPTANTQELVLMAGRDITGDCEKQLSVMRGLTGVFHKNQIGRPSQG